jgi:hypothetical protein
MLMPFLPRMPMAESKKIVKAMSRDNQSSLILNWFVGDSGLVGRWTGLVFFFLDMGNPPGQILNSIILDNSDLRILGSQMGEKPLFEKRIFW